MNNSVIREFIHALPKTETHLHLEGALPWELLMEMDPVKFTENPYFHDESFRYESFEQFESILIDHALAFFKSADSYYEASKLIFEKQLAQNVRYTEISFHAGMIEFLKIPGEEIIDAILSAIPDSLEVRVFLGISRNAYTEYLGPILEEALVKWDGLSGIDLHGLESIPMQKWTKPFWLHAGQCGKTLKAHAGEFGPSSNVAFSVFELGVRRIQHGVRAMDDPKLLQKLVDLGVAIDMCPISNYRLKVVDRLIDHPLKKFLDLGIRCTVSTDDPLSFGNNLEMEYDTCVKQMGCLPSDLRKIALNGFEVADIDSHMRRQLLNDVQVCFDHFFPEK
ncbi:MAG: adenosine deaminase [Verrucomicrobiota bacterium]|nr:adenosine deaminase [Verrucomicrobiota bacterium]